MSRNGKILPWLDALYETGLWLLLLFSPLLVGVANLDAYRTIQATFSLCLILLLLGVWGVKVTLADQWHRLSSLPAFWPLLAFVGWAFLSLFGAPSFALGGQSLLALSAYLLFFFSVTQWASTPERRERILLAMFIALFLNSVLSLLQYNRVDILSWGKFLPPWPLVTNYLAGLNAPSRIGSAAGVLGNQNVLAGYMVGPLMVAFAFLWVELRSWKAIPFALLSLLGFASLFASMTRGAWVGMAVALLFFLLLVLCRFRHSLWKRRWLSLGVLVGLLVLTTAGLQIVGPQRLVARATGEHHTLDQRMYVWNVARRMASERPVLGQGLGSFKVLYFRTLPKEFPQGIPDLLRHRYVQAHNDFIQASAELGYPGLLLLLGCVGWFFWERIRRLFALSSRDALLGAGELGGLLAMLIGATTGFPFHIAAASVVFAVIAGTLASRGAEAWPDDLTEKPSLLIQCAGIGILVLTLVGMTFFQYRADVLVKQGLNALQTGDYVTAENSLKQAIAYDGTRGDARVHLGFILATEGRAKEALPHLLASRSTFDDISTHFYLGYVYRGLGRRQEARREYLQALSYYPKGQPNRALIDRELRSLEATKGATR